MSAAATTDDPRRSEQRIRPPHSMTALKTPMTPAFADSLDHTESSLNPSESVPHQQDPAMSSTPSDVTITELSRDIDGQMRWKV
jgi:hypothetical protein